jgi:hypothetical protein
MLQFGKFGFAVVVAAASLTAFGLTVARSNAAQLSSIQTAGGPRVSMQPTFDKKDFRAPNFGAQRNIGMVNNLNKNRNISKGISPDG